MNGLQIDMKPAIGPLAVKIVTIAENDNAQGVVSFAAGASNFRGLWIVTYWTVKRVSVSFIRASCFLSIQILYILELGIVVDFSIPGIYPA